MQLGWDIHRRRLRLDATRHLRLGDCGGNWSVDDLRRGDQDTGNNVRLGCAHFARLDESPSRDGGPCDQSRSGRLGFGGGRDVKEGGAERCRLVE
nr:hypothetical protein CFP56_76069 [Quercus suber]